MNNTVLRFLKYFAVGFSTFLIDLFLLYVLTDIFLINYLLSTGLAFITAVSINYYFSRKIVFKKTSVKFSKGYYGFVIISGTGLLFIILLMAVFVELFLWNYLISRILVAGIVGVLSYLANLFINFKVAGKH